MIGELTRLMDNLDPDKPNKTVEDDPHMTNSASEMFNNTENMHRSGISQSLNADVSRVGPHQMINKRESVVSREAEVRDRLSECKTSFLVLKQTWERENSKVRMNNGSFNDTFEKEIEASAKQEKLVNVSNEFMLLNNEGYEMPEEPSKIDIPNESIDHFNKEDLKNLSIFKEN